MKKIILLLLFIPCMAYAQVFTSSSSMYSSGTVMMPDKYVEYLRGCKTYFVLPERLAGEKENLTTALKKVWDFNEIRAISLSEVDDLPEGKNAFFNIVGYQNEDFMYILMRLSVYISKPDATFKKTGEQLFAGFYLAPDVGAFAELLKIYRTYGGQHTLVRFGTREQATEDYMNFYYERTVYHNFYWGQICNYLAIINENLENAETRPRGAWGLMKVADESDIKNLKTETLYVPDYLLKTQKMVMGAISTSTTTEAELMGDYKYTYKMMPAEDISDLILSSKDPVYYIDFISGNLFTFFVVFNSSTHQAVYAKLWNSTVPNSKWFKEIVVKIDSDAKPGGPPNPFHK